MKPHDLVLGLIVGAVAVVFGLAPGLFDALVAGVRSFRESLLFGSLAAPRQPASIQPPRWLALAGALFMAFTVLVYLLS